MFISDVWIIHSLKRYAGWYLRLALLLFIASHFGAIGPRITPGPQQTVQTTQPLMCVHTRLIDEVWEWKIQRSLELVREMGADTIVEFFPWAYIEGTQGLYNWETTDRIIGHAQNQGLRVIARMGLVPLWARQPTPDTPQTTLNYLPRESYADFARFVADFAERYAGTVEHIIIWNEPNLSFEWGYDSVSAADYKDLLSVTYTAAHEANPDVVILAAGLAPTLEPEGSPHGLDDLIYLEQLYAAGAAPYFDALAVHTYGFTSPAASPPTPDTLNFRRAELLYNIMAQYNDADKPVYITESGWNDNPRWPLAVGPADRIRNTIDAYDYAEHNWPWLNKLCLWAFRYPAPTNSYPDNFTLVTSGFQIKPIYYALQDYALGRERSMNLWLPAPNDSP